MFSQFPNLILDNASKKIVCMCKLIYIQQSYNRVCSTQIYSIRHIRAILLNRHYLKCQIRCETKNQTNIHYLTGDSVKWVEHTCTKIVKLTFSNVVPSNLWANRFENIFVTRIFGAIRQNHSPASENVSEKFENMHLTFHHFSWTIRQTMCVCVYLCGKNHVFWPKCQSMCHMHI